MNPYIGNTLQLYGVEETRLIGGKGDGMRILHVRNGLGLCFEISLDRCGDISRLAFKGDNFGYFAPCGYVAPQYYDSIGAGFLKSFTAGFFTTCGLTQVGSPCTDEGEELPLHGTISNTPAESYRHWIEKDELCIGITVRDAAMFGRQLILEREYRCGLKENYIKLCDTVQNIGAEDSPLELLYHCNMGYPLLSETAQVSIPSELVTPRNEDAEKGMGDRLTMTPPQKGFQEQCFYYKFEGTPTVSIYNPAIGKGLEMTYDTAELPFFTEWKMMGEREYVLGLEPGNCTPDGRAAVRAAGNLQFLASGEEKSFRLTFKFTE